MSNSDTIIPEPDRKGLRDFGLLFGAMIVVVFGLLLPWLFERSWPRWPWIVLAVMTVWSLAAPMTLRPFYKVWMRFGLLMSRITTPIIMGVVFFVVITPVGLVRRAFANDSIKRSWDADASTYRVDSEQLPADRLNRPF